MGSSSGAPGGERGPGGASKRPLHPLEAGDRSVATGAGFFTRVGPVGAAQEGTPSAPGELYRLTIAARGPKVLSFSTRMAPSLEDRRTTPPEGGASGAVIARKGGLARQPVLTRHSPGTPEVPERRAFNIANQQLGIAPIDS